LKGTCWEKDKSEPGEINTDEEGSSKEITSNEKGIWLIFFLTACETSVEVSSNRKL
jgi:hypothetical protein